MAMVNKRTKMMVNLDLPQEMQEEIFQRMPLKSIVKFKSLSTEWKADLSSSRFMNLYRSHNPERLILLSRSDGYLHLLTAPTKKDDVWNPTPIQHVGGNWFKLFGSCKGFLLLLQRINKARNLFVVNPLTGQQIHIPHPPSVLREEFIVSYGFGYDSVSDDFKIVTLSRDCEDIDLGYPGIEVYAMKTRVWKKIAYPFHDDVVECKRIVPFVNGALHWYITDRSSTKPRRLVSFDLATESFGQIPFPKGLPDWDFDGLHFEGIDVLRGCLAGIGRHEYGRVITWVMNEYGVQDSWVRFDIPQNNNWTPVEPLRFVGDEKLLCTAGGKMQRWTLFDFNEGEWNLVGGRNAVKFVDRMVYEESVDSLG